eukprot:1102960-Prymnesium_polylepis.1
MPPDSSRPPTSGDARYTDERCTEHRVSQGVPRSCSVYCNQSLFCYTVPRRGRTSGTLGLDLGVRAHTLNISEPQVDMATD